ncbi:DUF3426 domain-containing protein [Virgifigura deserti]|uniref:DUF3426 domain-containing protein n=1 Tax=Virgifigura deserti TaxID=2268457 RepID=UPI003CCC3AAF
MQTPPSDMPWQVHVPPPVEETPMGRVSLPALMPPERRRARYGNVLLLGVLVGLVAGLAYFGQERIVSGWPQAKAFYDFIGVESTALGAGLELSNIKLVRRRIDGQDVVIITGSIFNETNEPQALPTLQATLRNEQNQWLDDWTFRTDRTELQPGEAASFSTTIPNPPEASKRVSITFIEDVVE